MVREHLWGLCDEMCENACVGAMRWCENTCGGFAMGCARALVGAGFATGCVVFGLEKRNCDLNHKNLRMDLVQKKKFRLGP